MEIKKEEEEELDRTVFYLAPESHASQTHPLQSKWVMWYFKRGRSRKSENNLKQINCIHTIEGYCRRADRIDTSRIAPGCDCMLSRKVFCQCGRTRLTRMVVGGCSP